MELQGNYGKTGTKFCSKLTEIGNQYILKKENLFLGKFCEKRRKTLSKVRVKFWENVQKIINKICRNFKCIFFRYKEK